MTTTNSSEDTPPQVYDPDSPEADPILTMIYERTPELYGFVPGENTVEENYKDILDTLVTVSSEKTSTGEFELDVDEYIFYLENMFFRTLEDLWFVTQTMAGSAFGYLARKDDGSTMLRDLATRNIISRFWVNYIFPQTLIKKAAGRTVGLDNTYDFDDLLKMFDHLPDNLKTVCTEFLHKEGKRIYPGQE